MPRVSSDAGKHREDQGARRRFFWVLFFKEKYLAGQGESISQMEFEFQELPYVKKE